MRSTSKPGVEGHPSRSSYRRQSAATDDDDDETSKPPTPRVGGPPPSPPPPRVGGPPPSPPRTNFSETPTTSKARPRPLHQDQMTPNDAGPPIGAYAVSTQGQQPVRRARDVYPDEQSMYAPYTVVTDQDEPEPPAEETEEQPLALDVPIAAEVTQTDEELQAQVDALQARLNEIEQPEQVPSVVKPPATTGSESRDAPERNDQERKRKRLCLALVYLFVFLLSILVAVVVVLVTRNKKDSNPSTAASKGPSVQNKTTTPPSSSPPSTGPPVTSLPVTPPVASPPVTTPPVTSPPATTPPVTSPPVTQPPTPVGPASWKPLGQELIGAGVADFVGHAVSLSRDGRVLVVGAPEPAESAGRVNVYRLDEATQTWVGIGEAIRGKSISYRFGWSVASNGDGTIVAVGAPPRFSFLEELAGYVSVYEFDDSTSRWTQIGSDIFGLNDGEGFGESVSLSDVGDILAVGAVLVDVVTTQGLVRLYNRDTIPPWQQMGQTLFGDDIEDKFGHSVTLSKAGTIVAIGAYDYGDDFEGKVSAFQYQYDTTSWVPLGDPLRGNANGERFGFSLDLDDSGSAMVVGARWGKADRKGSVSVFDYDSLQFEWNRRGQILHGKADYDLFGWSVSISSDGNLVAGGARFNDDNGNNTGQVRIFEYDSSSDSWDQVGSDLNGDDPHEEYGKSVSLGGTSTKPVIACGGPYYNNRRGHAEVFAFN